jgi:lactoylglutathione lyase
MVRGVCFYADRVDSWNMAYNIGVRMKLGYVIAYVPDVIKAVAFYEIAFSLERRFVHESQAYAEMETGETALAFAAQGFVTENGIGFPAAWAGHPPSSIEIGLVTESVQEAYDRAISAGATAVRKPKVTDWGQTVAYVRDLNGMLVELCTPMINA